MKWDHKLFQRHLTTRRFGREAVHFAELDSTNAYLAAHVDEFAMSGGVVIADHQTSGRGRHNRHWHDAPETALLFSLLLKSAGPDGEQGLWTLLPATAIASVLENYAAPESVQLKWPNDVRLHGRKIAGILGHSVVADGQTIAIIGAGINVSGTLVDFPPELRTTATSMLSETGQSISREVLLAEILAAWEALFDVLQTAGPAPILEQWERRGPPRGTRLTRTDGATSTSGAYAGLGLQGQLRLVDDFGTVHEFFSGETAS